MIKGIVFDIGGVLFTNGTEEAVRRISKKFKIDEKLVKEVFQGDLGEKYRKGKISREEFWKSAKKIWGESINTEEASKIWHESYKPHEEIFELLEELRKKGYKMFFLSDSTEERNEYLQENYGFLKYFEDGVFSHEVKMKKPERRIYELLLRKTGLKTEELLFIDDKEEFLEPAKKLGMKVLHFETPKKLKEDLKKIGVIFK
jgi:putative hydrolase of the HAD superfamily